ncbi:MAG TPA: hypothetical protein VHE54_10745 [Puia sp.]|nr:hypothetical protein [Puia sp.]
MGAVLGQPAYRMPVGKNFPDHLEFKRLYALPVVLHPKTTVPPSFTMPAAYRIDRYTDHLGFFCKEEIGIQRTLHIPIFFRLGSLEYCNKLEGK